MAALLLVSAATRAKAMTNAFIPAIQATILSRYSSCCFRCALCPSSDDGFHPHQRHHSIIEIRRRLFSALPLFDSAQLDNEQKILQRSNLSKNSFVEEVISFLDTNGMSMRPLSLHEIRNVLEQYMDQYHSNIDGPKSLDRVDGLMAFLEASVILAIGKGTGKNIPLGTNSSTPAVNATSHDNVDFENDLIDNTSVNSGNGMRQDINHQPHSFILHICPTLTLDTIHKLHQKQRTSSVSEAVAAYAWRNSLLTDAFYYYNSVNGGIEQSSIVHLHQDVWNRSPAIVQSRLRSKCGYYHRRIFARQTVVKRITKSDYIPFLEENHLWGATGAKYGYGVFLKSKMKGAKQHQTDAEDDEMLVAVATFSSKREVNRAGSKFHSYELLRFCTKLDTTVVGGLTKLVSAFVKEVKNKQTGKVDDSGSVQPGIDIVTAIDRDFGSNTWPNFERVQVLDPIPMFVGNIDGLRRHAVGLGLAPLEQVGDDNGSLSTSMILRAGLPTSMLQQLDDDDQTHEHDKHDWLWQIVAQHGFHPVFDAGVERLMFIAEARNTNEMSPSDLWDASLPNYVKEHYSVNSGVQRMLNSIRSTR